MQPLTLFPPPCSSFPIIWRPYLKMFWNHFHKLHTIRKICLSRKRYTLHRRITVTIVKCKIPYPSQFLPTFTTTFWNQSVFMILLPHLVDAFLLGCSFSTSRFKVFSSNIILCRNPVIYNIRPRPFCLLYLSKATASLATDNDIFRCPISFHRPFIDTSAPSLNNPL